MILFYKRLKIRKYLYKYLVLIFFLSHCNGKTLDPTEMINGQDGKTLEEESQLPVLSYTFEQIKNMNPEEIDLIHKDEDGYKVPFELVDFPNWKLEELTPDQLKELFFKIAHYLDFNIVTMDQIHSLTKEQFEEVRLRISWDLSPEKFLLLTPEQLVHIEDKYIPPEVITSFTVEQLRAVGFLSRVQRRAITPEQFRDYIGAPWICPLPEEYFEVITQEHINQKGLRCLSESQIKSLTPDQISTIEDIDLPRLYPPSKIKWFTPEQLLAIPKEEFALLPSQIRQMTPEQLPVLKEKGYRRHYRFLTSGQTKGFFKDVAPNLSQSTLLSYGSRLKLLDPKEYNDMTCELLDTFSDSLFHDAPGFYELGLDPELIRQTTCYVKSLNKRIEDPYFFEINHPNYWVEYYLDKGYYLYADKSEIRESLTEWFYNSEKLIRAIDPHQMKDFGRRALDLFKRRSIVYLTFEQISNLDEYQLRYLMSDRISLAQNHVWRMDPDGRGRSKYLSDKEALDLARAEGIPIDDPSLDHIDSDMTPYFNTDEMLSILEVVRRDDGSMEWVKFFSDVAYDQYIKNLCRNEYASYCKDRWRDKWKKYTTLLKYEIDFCEESVSRGNGPYGDHQNMEQCMREWYFNIDKEELGDWRIEKYPDVYDNTQGLMDYVKLNQSWKNF